VVIPTFINTAWFCVILFAIIVIGGSGYAGWKKYRNEVFWRLIKLFSSVLTITGIGVSLMNFDIATRALWKDEVQEQLLLEFIVARTELAMSMARICSETSALPDGKNTCWDLKNIGGQLSALNLRDRKPLEHIKNWQNNPRITEAVIQANQRIDWINQLIAIPVDDRQMVQKDGRALILFFVAVMFALATAGSIGEAAFQLRVAKDRQV
jgi:hypothetical protein